MIKLRRLYFKCAVLVFSLGFSVRGLLKLRLKRINKKLFSVPALNLFHQIQRHSKTKRCVCSVLRVTSEESTVVSFDFHLLLHCLEKNKRSFASEYVSCSMETDDAQMVKLNDRDIYP